MRGRGVDVEREDLVTQDPAVGAVGELDAEPVIVRGAPDRGHHLAQLGPVDDPEGEAGAGAHRRLLGHHPHQRLIVGARRAGEEDARPRRAVSEEARRRVTGARRSRPRSKWPARCRARTGSGRRGCAGRSGQMMQSAVRHVGAVHLLRRRLVVAGPVPRERQRSRVDRVDQRQRATGGRVVAAGVVAALAAVVDVQDLRPDRVDEVLLARAAGVDVGGGLAEIDRFAAGRQRPRPGPAPRRPAVPSKRVPQVGGDDQVLAPLTSRSQK